MNEAVEKKASTVLIVLDYPVTFGGVEYTELTLRRPLVRDMRIAAKASGTEADQEAILFTNLCVVSPEVIDSLDFVDYGKLSSALQNFQNPSLAKPI
jgi:hypothetical protein